MFATAMSAMLIYGLVQVGTNKITSVTSKETFSSQDEKPFFDLNARGFNAAIGIQSVALTPDYGELQGFYTEARY